MSPPGRTTLQQIAKEAGVCKATVSLALRNHPSLPASTVQRIQGIAEKMGYRPNPFVSALMTTVSKSKAPSFTATIGYLSGEGPEDFKKEPRRHIILNASRARAAELGYSFEHFWATEPGLTADRLTKILESRGIFGLLLGPFADRRLSGPMIELEWSRFSCASVTTNSAWPLFHVARSDHYGGTMQLFDELVLRGYRRIGVAMDKISELSQQLQYRAAATMHSLTHPQEKLVPVFEPDHFVEETFREWFLKHHPDVVVTVNPEILDWLQNLGKKVPNDVGFADLGVVPKNAKHSGIMTDAAFMGACGIDLVDAQLRRNERGIPPKRKTMLIEGLWNEGETLRPRQS